MEKREKRRGEKLRLGKETKKRVKIEMRWRKKSEIKKGEEERVKTEKRETGRGKDT